MADNSTPAFPSHGTMGEICQEGMTLRDYFAAKALPGVISAVMVHECHNWTSSAFAREAYELADAMLKARDA